jgi:hypothetical protein
VVPVLPLESVDDEPPPQAASMAIARRAQR